VLTDLGGKAGCLCQPAREGKLHCPLIVRPTSEDVITGHLVQVLRALNPHWWLADLLNQALGAPRFERQVYRRLRIDPWQNKPPFPRELLPWEEGSTQVDTTITWENPGSTIFIEAKYGSGLTPRTANDNGQHGFPSDQLVRTTRVGLLECGYFHLGEMFHSRPRDFACLLLSPRKGHPLVALYRDPERLRASIPHNDRLVGLPRAPFVGELSYGDISTVLQRQRRWFSRPEKVLLDLLIDYLALKRSQLPVRV